MKTEEPMARRRAWPQGGWVAPPGHSCVKRRRSAAAFCKAGVARHCSYTQATFWLHSPHKNSEVSPQGAPGREAASGCGLAQLAQWVLLQGPFQKLKASCPDGCLLPFPDLMPLPSCSLFQVCSV